MAKMRMKSDHNLLHRAYVDAGDLGEDPEKYGHRSEKTNGSHQNGNLVPDSTGNDLDAAL